VGRAGALLPLLLSWRHRPGDLRLEVLQPLIPLPRSQRDEPGQHSDFSAQVHHRRGGRAALHPGHRAGLPLPALPAPGRVADARERRRGDGQAAARREHRADPGSRQRGRRPGETGGYARRRTWGESRAMTDPQVAVMMLGIFICVIMLGFPIAFTLMALGVGFGYYAYY